MTVPECQPKPEKTAFFLKSAAERVSVSEYLQLRFQFGVTCDATEYQQLTDGARAIQEVAKRNGGTYDITGDVDTTFNPRLVVARNIVTNTSLPKYLAIRQEVLTQTMNAISQRLERLRALAEDGVFNYDDDIERASMRLMNLSAEINLSEKVMVAAKITPSSKI